MKREIYSTNTVWEEKVGYSRALKVKDMIFVCGTTAVDESGNIVGVGDAGKQADYIFQKIKKAIESLGGELNHVVRNKIYVTNIKDFEKIADVHHKYFADIKPNCTLVGINELVHKDMLVEIETDVVLD